MSQTIKDTALCTLAAAVCFFAPLLFWIATP